MKNKFVPFYFPQLHAIPENDQWWGSGYTDWDKVKIAKPLTPSHFQPRVPLDHNYYDQSLESTVRNQVALAEEYLVHGFNFYHYWFKGKLLLEKPINIFKTIDTNLRYCITWANESWSRRWDGKFNEVLIRQNHDVDYDEWDKHFDYLLQFFKTANYIKIDNKPVFMIYRPDIFAEVRPFVDYFNKKAIENGFQGLYFVAINAYEVADKNIYQPFNAILRFQPRVFFGSNKTGDKSLSSTLIKMLRLLPEKHQLLLGDLKYKIQRSTSYSIDDFWECVLEDAKVDLASKKKIYQSVITDWDNTARYSRRAKYFTDASPEKFEHYLKKLIAIMSVDKNQNHDNYIFINAWNEWSEGAYLEPDEKNQYRYLEVLRRLSR